MDNNHELQQKTRIFFKLILNQNNKLIEQNNQLIKINYEQSAQINELLDRLVDDGQESQQLSSTKSLDDI